MLNCHSDHQKQVDHGWGESTGEGEYADETAGQAIANQDKKESWDAEKNEAWAGTDQPATIPEEGAGFPEAEPEPEDNSKSYADYLAEQATKRMQGLGMKEARAANEGSKDNKKWKSAKELPKQEDEDYFKGQEKAHRERDRAKNAKQTLDIDYAFKEQPRDSRGGGRGGPRGRGRGRGDGDRPDRPDRGDRPERGRGGRGRGDFQGEFRGGRGRGGRGRGDGPGAPVAVNDETAFPSLGGK